MRPFPVSYPTLERPIPIVLEPWFPLHGRPPSSEQASVFLLCSDVCFSVPRLSKRGVVHDPVSVAYRVCRFVLACVVSCVSCCLPGVIAHPPSGDGARSPSRSAAEHAGPIRFLRSVIVVVAVVLCQRRRAEPLRRRDQCAMRGAALFVRRTRVVAAI